MSIIGYLLGSLLGTVVIAWLASLLLGSAIGTFRVEPIDRAEYKWLAFRVTMQVSALAASIYGFTNAADIIDAVTRIIRP